MFKLRVAALALSLFGASTAAHAYVIKEDRGGTISTYEQVFTWLQITGQPVAIDGLCASACTLALGIISQEKLCVTSRAVLAFHQAWKEGSATVNGKEVKRQIANRDASEYIYKKYPRPIRDWIFLHGGLPPPQRTLDLKGADLKKLVRSCDTDA